MFRWGILSTAKIAREHVIPAIVDSENGLLQAIASRNIDTANDLAARFGAKASYSSYEDLLASDDIDGVYIPLPTSQHTEWSIKAADAGKHVLCEKPIAMTASDVDRLINVRDRNKVLISEAFMVNYHPQWHKVRDLVANGAIGRLRRVDGAFSYFNDDPDNMRNRPELGGGGIRDIGVYPTVTTRLVTGQEPRRVRATIDTHATFGTDTYASVSMEFDGFDLSFYCSTQMGLRQSMVFAGETGWIEVRAPFNADLYAHSEVVLHNQGRGESETFRFADTRQYRREVEAFADAAAGGESSVFDLENSRANQAVIDAIFNAGASGDWIDIA